MRAKRSTGQSKTEEGAAQELRRKRNPAKALCAGDGRFKNIFDESPIGIELYDSDGLLMDANPVCLRMFGVSDLAQVKGFKLFEDPNLPDKAKAKLRRGKPVRYEAPFDFEKVKELRLYETSKSGIVHLDVLITPVGVKRKAAPQGFLVQVQDITERKQTEEMLRYHAEELAALQATTLDLAAQQDLLSLLNTIVERAMALLNAPCGFIYLHDAKTNELELVAEHGLAASPGLRLRMWEGMAGQVARTRQPLIVDDYSTWEGRSPQYADIPYHAVIEVPMLFGGQLIGILGVNEISATTRRYNEADARLLSLFAGQAASAVRNARLFQGLQVELAERKRTEQALLQTEKRYRTLFEQSPDGILLIDPETELPIVFNTAAHHQLGYSRDEFARLRIADYEVIEKPEVTQAHIEKIIQEGRDDFETGHRTKQGEIRNVHVTVQTIELAGRPVLNCIFRDITERKRAEEELRHYAQQIESLRQVELELAAELDLNVLLKSIVLRAIELMRGNMGGLYLYRPEQDIIEWAVSLGTQAAPIGSVLHRGEGLSGKVWETGEPLSVDDYRCWEGRAEIYKDPDFVSVVGVPVYWGEEFLGVLNVGSDQPGAFSQANAQLLNLFASQAAIAMHNAQLYEAQQKEIRERKQAEEALQENEERSRRTLDNMMEGCQIIGFDWRYLYVNDAVTQHGRQTREALLGRTMMEVYPGIENTEMFAVLRRCMNERTSHQMENEFTYPDGTKAWFELSIQPVPEGIFILSIDITAHKRAEKARETTHQISQATVSTESLEELYHSIHELLGELMPVENFYIAMYDPGNDLLSFPYFVDQYDQPIPPKKPGRGLTEYVLRTGKPLLAPPEVFDQLLQQGEVELVGTNSVDWLGVPLKVKDHVIGVMVTQSYTEGIRFSQEDADLLGFVSTQAAQAIERKRAEEKIHQQLEELRRWQSVMLGREDRIQELKREVNELLKNLNLPSRYGKF